MLFRTVRAEGDIRGIVVTGEVQGDVVQIFNEGGIEQVYLRPQWEPEIRENDSAFTLLHWKRRLTPLHGRDDFKQMLLDWALEDSAPVRIRLVSGEGGVGKTRLLAEVADTLHKDHGWNAGFIIPGRPVAYPIAEGAGCFLIIDYPEDGPERIAEELRSLAGQDIPMDGGRVRVVLLSRPGARTWESVLDRYAPTRTDGEISLPPLGEEGDAYALFEGVRARLAGVNDLPEHVDRAAFERWLQELPANNRRPLFITAAALHQHLFPEKNVVRLGGALVMEDLVRREADRLRRESEGRSWPRDSLLRLTAMAALLDGIDRDAAHHLAKPEFGMGLPEADALVAVLPETSVWKSAGGIPCPEPELLAAAFVHWAFKEANDENVIPEWIWAALVHDRDTALNRLGRITYDAEVTLALLEPRQYEFPARKDEQARANGVGHNKSEPFLSGCVARVLNDRPERASFLENTFSETNLSYGVLKLAIAAESSLLADGEKVPLPVRAGRLNNISVHYSEAGRASEAVAAIEEAVGIYRILSEDSEKKYAQDLSMSLSNACIRFKEVGRLSDAISAIEESVRLRRALHDQCPAPHAPYLASSLNNAALCYKEAGFDDQAIEALEEVVKLRRSIQGQSSTEYALGLASSLNNASNLYRKSGKPSKSIETIEEALVLYRELHQRSPACLSPILAGTLNTASLCYKDAGRTKEAVETLEEAIAIHRSLYAQSPSRYAPDLAMSLSNASYLYRSAGRVPEALNTIEIAIELNQELYTQAPARYAPDLARSLGVKGLLLVHADKKTEAAECFREGCDLLEPYARAFPKGEAGRLLKTMERDLAILENPEK